ncbi:MAG: PadR family transcriptional regulator [Thermoflexales bacterium]|nr:PadR family transcriptional regulator [Thermoflexales bacterium]MDW8352059.1 PadR family transcriptional regulator [Anaerolineae bacterium]
MERELLLLGLLRQGAMHGYQLNDFIERNLAFCTDLKKSTAYVLLDKLQARGWVTMQEARAGNRPHKRVYSLTAAGEDAFQRLLRENLGEFVAAKTGSDIGLAFIDALPKREALRLLNRRRAALAEQLTEFESAPQHQGSYQLLIDHQLNYLRCELEWLSQVIARMQSRRVPLRRGSARA